MPTCKICGSGLDPAGEDEPICRSCQALIIEPEFEC